MSPSPAEQQSQIVQGFREVGLQHQRPFIKSPRLSVVPGQEQGVAEVVQASG